jgi:RNA polymerase sigma factor FliA
MCMPEGGGSHRKEVISLLAQRIAELPRVQKKVLAMYYYENMQLADLA